MNLNLPRLLIYALTVQLFYMVSFPDWEATPYHWVMVSILTGSAVALWAGHRALIRGTLTGVVLFEFSFFLGSVLYVGWSMPQESGKPPIMLVIEGRRLSRGDAKKGLGRLGINPDSAPGRLMLGLYPKR